MMSEFKYKGYKGSCEISIEDACLHGRIQDIDDLISYEAETVIALKQNFEIAVDEYLAHCASVNKEASKPYSGSFNVRVGAELHKAAVQKSRANKQSLNDFVYQALSAAVSVAEKLSAHHEITVKHIFEAQFSQEIKVPFSEENNPWHAEQKMH